MFRQTTHFINMLKEHGFTVAVVKKNNNSVNIVYFGEVREDENNSLGSQKQQGLSFFFQFAPHAAGYGSSALLNCSYNFRTWPNYLEHLRLDAHLHTV